MKKTKNPIKQLLSAGIFLSAGFIANGQLLETMGTAGSGTQTIAARETAGSFDLTALTYVGTADMRTTSASTGYTGASGGYNTLIQAQETFEMQGINASSCSVSDSIRFGVFKSTNASNGIDYLVLEYSDDNGASWYSISFPALPTGSGTAKWHHVSTALPSGALIPNLRIRFRNSLVGSSSSNPQFRIDDIEFTCGSTTSCDSLTASISVSGKTVLCAGETLPSLTSTTNVSDPIYQWYNQDGAISGAEMDVLNSVSSGTYHVVISDENGCEVVSEDQYVLVYPAAEFCAASVDGCVGDTTQVCTNVKANGLIISEYVEGSGFNKYLEIFNGTCGSVDLSDYELRAYHNGASMAGTPTFTIPLTGTLANGSVYVVAHPSATAWTGTPNLLSANLQFNGDDALVLYNATAGTISDIFGSVGHDPGSAWRDADTLSATYGWRTVDKTLIRKACIHSGITVNPDLPGINGFPTLTTEWDTLPEDNVSNLGMHTFGAAGYSFSVASGDATILSSTDNCVTVIVGRSNSVLTVNGTFCDANCSGSGSINVNVSCDKSAASSSKKPGVQPDVVLYPNPTNGEAVLVFETATDGDVVVTLTDLSGKHVNTLYNGSMTEGKHRVKTDLSGIQSGVYLIQIVTANERTTLRVVKSDK